MRQLYDVLGLDSSASREEITRAIAKQRRIWRKRTTSPDIEARQDAELQMHTLDEAERVLLDEDRRTEYDATGHTLNTETTSEHSTQLIRALHQMESNQHGAAVFTAQRAIEEDPENAYAYSVLAEAAVGASDPWIATDAIDKALRLEPEDARLHAQRAAILDAADEPARALTALRTALSLAPEEPEYHARLIQHLSENGEIDLAIAEGERAYQQHPDSPEVICELARALAERAALAQNELPNGRLVITTPEEASHVEALCDRGLSLEAPDPEIVDDLTTQRRAAQRAMRRRFSSSAFKRSWKWSVGLGLFATAALFCTPNFSGENVDASVKGFGYLVVLSLLASFAIVLWVTAFEPQYRRNAAAIEHTVPRRRARGPAPAAPHGSGASYRAVRPRTPSENSSRPLSQRHRAAKRREEM